VFFITSSLLLLNAIWVYFKVYKKVSVLQNQVDKGEKNGKFK